MNKQLYDFIDECIKKNIPEQKIRAALVSKGWNLQDVDEAINALKKNSPSVVHHKTIYVVVSTVGILAVVLFIIISLLGAPNENIASENDINNDNLKKTDASSIQNNPSVVDCEDDMWCFIYAASTCSLAKVTFKSNSSFQGNNVVMNNTYEIKNMQNDGCVMDITLVEISPPVQEPSPVGKSGICSFIINDDLVRVLTKIRDGEFSGGATCKFEEDWYCTTFGDLEVAKCYGDLFIHNFSIEKSSTSNNVPFGGIVSGGESGGGSPSSEINQQQSEPGLIIRSFSSNQVSVEDTITVTLTKNVQEDSLGLLIEEIFPSGWTMLDSGSGSVYENSIRWAEITDVESGTLTYTLIAPDNSGTSTWTGSYIINGGSPVNIAGDNQVSVVE